MKIKTKNRLEFAEIMISKDIQTFEEDPLKKNYFLSDENKFNIFSSDG